jgi:ATP-dependent DNA helicase DinG
MARLVERAIFEKRHALLEAETGIGKTLAYLAPALMSGKKTVVSTSTKTLQSQLWEKDIPLLRRVLDVDFEAALLKGRKNYLCLWRMREAHERALFHTKKEAEAFGAVRAWADETETGHVSEMAALAEDSPLWERLTVSSEECLGSKCAFYDDCFVTRARARALPVDLIVVNHHLYVADLAVRDTRFGKIIPDHDVVVFDEAHTLERVATQFFGVSVARGAYARFAADARKRLASLHPPPSDPPSAALRGTGALRAKEGYGGQARSGAEKEGGEKDAALLSELEEAAFAYFDRRVPSDFASRAPLRPHADEAAFRRLRELMRDALARLEARTGAAGSEAEALLERGADLLGRTEFLASASDEDFAYFVEALERTLILRAYPIEVGPLLAERVFAPHKTAVLTSATLTVGGTFDFVRARLGAPEETLSQSFESQFDYAEQSLLYVPTRLPAPNARDAFLEGAAEEARALVEAARGRTFLLFTSFGYLEALYERLRGPLKQFMLLRQGDAPRERILEKFRETEGAVLFGTTSFWEGVDIQGDALVAVVVDRLPFEVPDDPLLKARLARIKASGKNPFWDYQVPQAALSLKQGLGRLIRSRTDRGVLCVLDSRIVKRSYGKIFLETLPPCRLTSRREEALGFLHQC